MIPYRAAQVPKLLTVGCEDAQSLSSSPVAFTAAWDLAHTCCMATFDDFMAGLEAEARVEGSEAVADLEALHLHFRLAHQLVSRRRTLRLTQTQLAEMTGIDRAEISRIERGQANPTTATLATLTRALGVDVRRVPAA